MPTSASTTTTRQFTDHHFPTSSPAARHRDEPSATRRAGPGHSRFAVAVTDSDELLHWRRGCPFAALFSARAARNKCPLPALIKYGRGGDTERTRKIMKKFAFALLATAALSMPAAAQQQQAQSPNQAQPQKQTQPQNSNQTAQNQRNQGQPISPGKLSRSEVRQVQQALDKSGFHAGTADGRWGPETSNALKQFQQSKKIQANGQLNQQTLSGLGLNGAQFAQQNKPSGQQRH
jgi:hypothetical protein